ncbi:ADP-ribosylation factor-like protein 3 [Drosophila tropicalis]|uniref:ADP-ribosylation factor-like protein 3 n=1 Tax=Drosophila tropicalis TaxID=46794 RepID=UPI0035AB9765
MCSTALTLLVRNLLGIRSQESNILVLGLDNAGKSTLIAQLINDQCNYPLMPTLEPHEIHTSIKEARVCLWDLSGHIQKRMLWSNYYENKKAVIYVIDGKDASRLSEARCALCDLILNDHLQQVPLLIVANKQDLGSAISSSMMSYLLGLDRLEEDTWEIKECSALTGNGIENIRNWIYSKAKK